MCPSRDHSCSHFVHVAAHGTEIRCESVGSTTARKWPRECTSDGVITIGAHRLRRRCRSMIAMDGRGSEKDRHDASKREGKEDRKQEGREKERESVNREEAPANRRRIARRMEILRHERWRTEDFINVRERKDPPDWKTKDTRRSESTPTPCTSPSLFV